MIPEDEDVVVRGALLLAPVDEVTADNMHSVTSNAVAAKFSGLGTSVTLLGTATNYNTVTIPNIDNYKWIAVIISNDEATESVALRLYPSAMITFSQLYHDTARFDGTYYLTARYRFDNKTSFRVIHATGTWNFKYAKVYGIK